jgi:predicted ATPase
LDLSFSKGKNVIVGRNNAGKSNIIKALDIVLGENSPTYAKSENITDNDFYTWKEKVDEEEIIKSADEIFIWCELEREDDEQLDYDAIYKCYGYYVHAKIIEWERNSSGKSVPIKEPVRIPSQSLPNNHDAIFAITEDDSPGKMWIDPKLRNQRTFEKQLGDKIFFAYAFHAYKDEFCKIEKDIRFLYRENELEDWILAFKASIRNELLQSAIIPSFRDPFSQLRVSSWTWYGKLLKHLTEGYEESQDLQAALAQVKKIADEIFLDVNESVAQSALDIAFPGTSLHFQFNAETKADLHKSCVIYVDDGFKSLLTEKGSGIQSATIIGLFNYYVRHVSTVTSALLCVEEPEIYLHPHAQRVIGDRLDDFLEGCRNQVILTTHSSQFIRTTLDDLNIILVQKSQNETKATPIKIREYKHLLIDNNQNELFFADKVVICEGFDDYILRAVAREFFPKTLDEQNVSIISTGGKNNISQLAKLVVSLGIKCFLLADFDYLLRDKGDDRKKYGDVRASESLQSLGVKFFKQSCIFGDDGVKAYSNITRLRRKLKESNEEAFYMAKTFDVFADIPLTEELSNLRQNGICILPGEIENLSKDKTFISPTNKLSLDKVYEINARLLDDPKISSLFDTQTLVEFLQVVFSR